MSDHPKTILDPKRIEKKMRIMNDLFFMAYECKRYQLRKKFPDLSEREINHRAYALIERGCK
jgi:hypothetical protein